MGKPVLMTGFFCAIIILIRSLSLYTIGNPAIKVSKFQLLGRTFYSCFVFQIISST